jgi:large subunit ribosomal protein L24
MKLIIKKPVKTKLKRGDRVVIIAGKDKGKEGKILKVDKIKSRVIIENANMVTRHMKPNRQNQRGGIVNVESPLAISNVMYLHKGKPTRLGYQVTEIEKDGKMVKEKKRFAKSTGDIID